MPELPEVETIKRQLEKKLVGLTISDVEVRNEKSFTGKRLEVTGKKIAGVERRGKMMVWELADSGQARMTGNKEIASSPAKPDPRNDKLFLVFHLKMSGQILYATRKDGKRDTLREDKHVRVVFHFNDGSKLYFRDVRKFGWIKIISNLKSSNLFGSLGAEPFSSDFTTDYLSQIAGKTKKPIKTLLMEQTKIAGIGNIYSNEALFLAKIRPTRTGKSLTPKEIETLYNSILAVLEEGISHEGSSGKDKGYVTAFGESGKHQKYFKVYQREGEKCKSCGETIQRIVIGGRGTFFCGECQK